MFQIFIPCRYHAINFYSIIFTISDFSLQNTTIICYRTLNNLITIPMEQNCFWNKIIKLRKIFTRMTWTLSFLSVLKRTHNLFPENTRYNFTYNFYLNLFSCSWNLWSNDLLCKFVITLRSMLILIIFYFFTMILFGRETNLSPPFLLSFSFLLLLCNRLSKHLSKFP